MDRASERTEERSLAKVAVDLSSLNLRTPAQDGITENVSSHGARIVTPRGWRAEDRINVRSLRGDLHSRARVVYCEPLAGGSFAIGVELIARTGKWVYREKCERTAAAGRAGKPGRP
jgi:hypothetical protein